MDTAFKIYDEVMLKDGRFGTIFQIKTKWCTILCQELADFYTVHIPSQNLYIPDLVAGDLILIRSISQVSVKESIDTQELKPWDIVEITDGICKGEKAMVLDIHLDKCIVKGYTCKVLTNRLTTYLYADQVKKSSIPLNIIIDTQSQAVTTPLKCECGSESVGSQAHSSWCKKFQSGP